MTARRSDASFGQGIGTHKPHRNCQQRPVRQRNVGQPRMLSEADCRASVAAASGQTPAKSGDGGRGCVFIHCTLTSASPIRIAWTGYDGETQSAFQAMERCRETAVGELGKAGRRRARSITRAWSACCVRSKNGTRDEAYPAKAVQTRPETRAAHGPSRKSGPCSCGKQAAYRRTGRFDPQGKAIRSTTESPICPVQSRRIHGMVMNSSACRLNSI